MGSGWAPRGPLAPPAASARLTPLDELLRLPPHAAVAQKPPLALLADLTLQVVLLRDLQEQHPPSNTDGPTRPRSHAEAGPAPQPLARPRLLLWLEATEERDRSRAPGTPREAAGPRGRWSFSGAPPRQSQQGRQPAQTRSAAASLAVAPGSPFLRKAPASCTLFSYEGTSASPARATKASFPTLHGPHAGLTRSGSFPQVGGAAAPRPLPAPRTPAHSVLVENRQPTAPDRLPAPCPTGRCRLPPRDRESQPRPAAPVWVILVSASPTHLRLGCRFLRASGTSIETVLIYNINSGKTSLSLNHEQGLHRFRADFLPVFRAFQHWDLARTVLWGLYLNVSCFSGCHGERCNFIQKHDFCVTTRRPPLGTLPS